MTKAPDTVQLKLAGVPETLLWPLWNRAVENERAKPLLDDPWSTDLVRRIDFDFPGHFGRPSVFHPIRARVCDELIRAYRDRAGTDGTVIALGEGLDSQRLRVGDNRLRWYSVDVPESQEVRQQLLPPDDTETAVSCSALDERWMTSIEVTHPPFITALGLLMYFTEAQVVELLTRLGERFPGAEVFFDTIPPFFSRKTMAGFEVTNQYTAPPMPWGISYDDLQGFVQTLGHKILKLQTYAEPFPQRTRFYWLLGKIPPIRSALAASLVHIRLSE
ncbi:MAG: class I SAM-dependent methyltransferase [Pseudomonadota bacterium]